VKNIVKEMTCITALAFEQVANCRAWSLEQISSHQRQFWCQVSSHYKQVPSKSQIPK